VQAEGGTAYANAAVRPLNQQLIEAERNFLWPEGLPGRPWYKNQIYAPGAYTGYAVKTIPAVREALEQKQWEQEQHSAAVVGQLLEKEAAAVEAAAERLESMAQPK